ncbi:interferon-related developmental regulator 1 [Macadamia integrifolia]|uniref:interferon-related developmental regulator 1 n=1 Tax=Macadamia integrifolia TaxID=60698 RepID=UPI001C4E37A6|nr:interferon-related developmental regulator 1 [Macadamia integrifolia]
MGKRSSRGKNASMFDSDDDGTGSSSSNAVSELTVSENEDLESNADAGGNKVLDECVDALHEKRGSTREKALSMIVDAFTNKLQYQFVEKNCVTLLHPCINSIKKGSSKETSLASHAIGLLSLTVGCGDSAAEILEESIPTLSQALKSGLESTKISSVLDCLAIVTFVGGNDPDVTERSMQIMWQIIHPKLGPNVSASKATPAVLTAAISAWSFLLTTVKECNLNSKIWQDSISHFSSLLDKDDRSIRIATGEAIALIFEIRQVDKSSGEDKGSTDSSVQEGNNSRERYAYVHGLRGKILNQVRNLSVEAGGKGSTRKYLGSQRNLFRDIVEFLEDGYCPETSIKIGGDFINTSTWSQLIQLNFLKRFLGDGFPKHMQENELLQDIFEFTPKKKQVLGNDQTLTSGQKRMFKSPNSVYNKARTQFLNKQRQLSQDRNAGHFTVTGSEET